MSAIMATDEIILSPPYTIHAIIDRLACNGYGLVEDLHSKPDPGFKFCSTIMSYNGMKRYMLHLQNTLRYSPKEATELLHRAREIVEPEASIRDARVSKKYIEYDISIQEGKDLRSLLTRIEVIAPLASYEEIMERHMEKDEAIKRAVELFNDERYWEAHEALEYVWKNATGTEKEILNGIILVAAAFVHDEKD